MKNLFVNRYNEHAAMSINVAKKTQAITFDYQLANTFGW